MIIHPPHTHIYIYIYIVVCGPVANLDAYGVILKVGGGNGLGDLRSTPRLDFCISHALLRKHLPCQYHVKLFLSIHE